MNSIREQPKIEENKTMDGENMHNQTNYVEQHPLFLTAETSSLVPRTMVSPLGKDVA